MPKKRPAVRKPPASQLQKQVGKTMNQALTSTGYGSKARVPTRTTPT